MTVTDFTAGVEQVWVVWLLSLVAGTGLVVRSAPRRRRGPKRLLLGECGASYALPYVLTFPLFLMLICLIVQSTHILIVKMGTVYAAYAGARAAIVWRAADPDSSQSEGDDLARRQAHKAAVLAVASVASGSARHADLMAPGPASTSPDLADSYVGAYGEMAGNVFGGAGRDAPRESYLRNKVNYARGATTTTVEFVANAADGRQTDAHVKVSYVMPLAVPLAGAVLRDSWQGWLGTRTYTRTIHASCRMPVEDPQTDSQRLSIRYAPQP